MAKLGSELTLLISGLLVLLVSGLPSCTRAGLAVPHVPGRGGVSDWACPGIPFALRGIWGSFRVFPKFKASQAGPSLLMSARSSASLVGRVGAYVAVCF